MVSKGGAGTLLGVCAILAVAVPSAHGDTVTVSQCDEASLRSAVNAAASGDTIAFGCDGTITLTQAGGGSLMIQKDLTLNGTGQAVTISGGDAIGILESTSDLTVRSLTLADGNRSTGPFAAPGGAIFNSGDLVLDDVSVLRNSALKNGGAIYSIGSAASLSVSDSTFKDNVSFCDSTCQRGGGGAISVLSGGPTTVTGSVFEGNRTSSLNPQTGEDLGYGRGSGGGAILAPRTFTDTMDGPVEITSSEFRDNTARLLEPETVPNGGGAVMVHNHGLTISESLFDGNEAVPGGIGGGQERGGAVLVVGETGVTGFGLKPAVISDSEFTDNTGTDGGAIHVVTRRASPADDVQRLSLVDSQLTGNTGGTIEASGGALTNSLASVEIEGTLIADNVATGAQGLAQAGGVTTVGAVASTAFTDSTLEDNTGPQPGCVTLFGGLILNKGGNSEAPGNTCGFASDCAGAEPTIAGYGEIAGTPGDDVIVGLGSAGQSIDAGSGMDSACGKAGDDEILGGPGDDTLQGNGGADRLRGKVGDDDLDGGIGLDRLWGGLGKDVCAADRADKARSC